MSSRNLEYFISIIETFTSTDDFTSWLIDLGKTHTVRDCISLRVSKNYIRGCQTAVWLSGNEHNDTWTFSTDSDIYYVKGIAHIVSQTYNGLGTEEISNITYQDFKPVSQALPTLRQRGLQSMINRIHNIVNSI